MEETPAQIYKLIHAHSIVRISSPFYSIEPK